MGDQTELPDATPSAPGDAYRPLSGPTCRGDVPRGPWGVGIAFKRDPSPRDDTASGANHRQSGRGRDVTELLLPCQTLELCLPGAEDDCPLINQTRFADD